MWRRISDTVRHPNLFVTAASTVGAGIEPSTWIARLNLMQKCRSGYLLTASDLAGHLNCRHLTALNLAVANGALTKPSGWDPVLATLVERGETHERNFIEHLRQKGNEVFELPAALNPEALAEQTTEAMRRGVEYIVQGGFLHGEWMGRADVLRRVDGSASRFGKWSYEVIDTKLARETKGATILQLCLYSDLLAQEQGVAPENMSVVVPWSGYEPLPFRFASFAAYYRKVRREFAKSLGRPAETYPDPTSHCSVCRWREPCDERRRSDDHLCLVAGITKFQIAELNRHDVRTATRLAAETVPLQWKPERGARVSYERIRHQSLLQVKSRGLATPLHELLRVERGLGLGALPAPSAGDIFLDLEGDPFAGSKGMEYLFGYAFLDENGQATYVGDWALTREDERNGFQRFIDFTIDRRSKYPDLHIFHYAPYEPAALKRLMGRYATREEELDALLRAGVFVDLYQVTRHAIRAGVESYSIKELEQFFGYERRVPLHEASRARAALETCLELEDTPGITTEMRRTVAAYNQDDCISARSLRDWLEQLRAEQIAGGEKIDRPIREIRAPNEARLERQARVEQLVAHLTAEIPADATRRSREQQARWVLAHLLEFESREEKATWWELFRLKALSETDLADERAGLTGLRFVANVGGTTKCPVHRYAFPPQETELKGDEQLYVCGGVELGSIEGIDEEAFTIDIKKRQDAAGVHPAAIFGHRKPLTREVLDSAIERIAVYVIEHGIEGEGDYQAARDLLLALPPRLPEEAMFYEGESSSEAAARIAKLLKGGVFAIQGPPGTGKTYTGARMICALVQRRARVAITSNSHKVVRKLIEDTIAQAAELGVALNCIVKPGVSEPDVPHISFTKKSDAVFAGLRSGAYDVGGGTAWLWADEDAREVVDVLFVDEAAQLSLAKVLAASHCAKTIVLLGDPQQLEQPTQGSHPEGTDMSALDHVLGGAKTLPIGRGLFLEETWRLHPEICKFTSELFYEGRLRSKVGCEQQVVRSNGRISGSGLRYLTVPHEANTSSSREEAVAVKAVVEHLLSSSSTWLDSNGIEKKLELQDILIITPYNAQISELGSLLPDAKIGTVDKFQGQQGAVVIFSMATSSSADAPRGMDFLYSLKRLNVATSRARCLCIIVCSPRLFEPECRSPAQMEMANAFCRYLELATAIDLA